MSDGIGQHFVANILLKCVACGPALNRERHSMTSLDDQRCNPKPDPVTTPISYEDFASG